MDKLRALGDKITTKAVLKFGGLIGVLAAAAPNTRRR